MYCWNNNFCDVALAFSHRNYPDKFALLKSYCGSILWHIASVTGATLVGCFKGSRGTCCADAAPLRHSWSKTLQGPSSQWCCHIFCCYWWGCPSSIWFFSPFSSTGIVLLFLWVQSSFCSLDLYCSSSVLIHGSLLNKII